MASRLTLTRDVIELAVKQYIERQGYTFVKFVTDEYRKEQFEQPGCMVAVVEPKTILQRQLEATLRVTPNQKEPT